MTFLKILNIVTVDVLLLARWWPVKIPIVSVSGFTLSVFKRKIFQKSGTVLIVKSNVRKQKIQILEVILLTNNLRQLDNY